MRSACITDAFVSRWRACQTAFEAWCGVAREFPKADATELEYAAKVANRRIWHDMNEGRTYRPSIYRSWNAGSAA